MNLELNQFEVIFLEVLLERQIMDKRNVRITTDREEEILKKIYSISPSTERKFPELTK